jgi:hypothetical protein
MGKHTVTICTDRFEILAQITAQGIGMPDLPLVVVSHPIGGISPEEVKIKADNIIEKIIDRLVQQL